MTATPERIRELFARALELPPAERRAWLERACDGDAALLARLQDLVAAHERSGSFLADPGADVRSAAAASVERAGEAIGAYKLLENIGEGGFGTVWMAEQRQPVRRLVALKVLKAGMDSAQVVARFEQERQALALMAHPNVAQVFDAGTTDRGRPFFVMELVKGVPITDYCEREKLPVRARLALFVQVCRAVQHAHGKGVIHRDIKPRNVLVATADGKPLAKVIDFGIAKATGARLTEATLWTEHRAMVGTLEYMSPEQAEGLLDVDTRSDVYSLGALLYELLTGSTPFDSQKLIAAGYGEILRVLREVEPQRPSLRVSTGAGWAGGAKAAGREAKDLFGVLKGDLDWVVLKALEKDRGRRYASADGLAEDVERYLGGEAVQAVPPSVGYRVRKFVRKNRSLVASSATILLALFVATFVIVAAEQRAAGNERAKQILADLADGVVAQIKLTPGISGGTGLDEALASFRYSDDAEGDKAVVDSALGLLQGSLATRMQFIEAQREVERIHSYGARLNAARAYGEAGANWLANKSLEQCSPDLRGWEWRYVAAANAEQVRILLHGMTNPDLWDVSRDGSRIAAVNDESVLSVFLTGSWDLEARQVIESEDVQAIGMTSGDDVVIGQSDSLTLFSPASGATVRRIAAPGNQLWGCSSRDRRWIAHIEDDKTARNDDVVTFWDVTTGRAVIRAHLPSADDPSFSHDGQFLACRSGDRTWIWDSDDGAPIMEVPDRLMLNPQGPLSCSRSGLVVDPVARTATAWPVATDHAFDHYVGAEHVMLYHPKAQTVELRRISDGAPVDLPSGARRRPWQGTTAVTFDLFRHYASWDAEDVVFGVSLITGEDLPTEPFRWWRTTELSADGKWWVGVDAAARLAVVSARPPRHTSRCGSAVLAIATSGDPLLPCASALTGSNRRVFNECAGACVVEQLESAALDRAAGCQTGDRFLYLCGVDAFVADVASVNRAVHVARGDDVQALAMSADGSLAALLDGSFVHWWETPNPATVHRLPVPAWRHADPPLMAIAPGRVALGGGDLVRLQSLSEEAECRERVVESGSVTGLLFEPDGSRLLVGTSSGIALILLLPTLEVAAILRGHDGPVSAMAWSPDGDRAFTAGVDGTVRVWHARPPTNEAVELLSLTEPSIAGKPTCLLFPPDGERLICGYDDGSIRVWDSVPWSERVDRRNAAVRK